MIKQFVTGRVFVFIDAANILYSQQSLRWRVDYEKLKTKNYFLQGIERLKVAFEKDLNIILMCSELNPCDCHRSKVIGKVLESENIKIMHIDEKEKVQEQLTIINKLNKGLSEYDLFGNPVNSTSKKSFLKKEDGEN